LNRFIATCVEREAGIRHDAVAGAHLADGIPHPAVTGGFRLPLPPAEDEERAIKRKPVAAGKFLDDLQAAPVDKLPVDEEWITVPAAVGEAHVRIIRPKGSTGVLPVILYMHGGGWILGNAGTHDRLVRELAVGVGSRAGFRGVPELARGALPGRDRAGVRDRAVDHP
jgi:acetyl esterase/lipase